MDKLSLLYDGGMIDVLWDQHEQAVEWYGQHMGMQVIGRSQDQHDPQSVAERYTSLRCGDVVIHLKSVLANQRLAHFHTDRGTGEPAVRWCFMMEDLAATRVRFREAGIHTSELYEGPGYHTCFDFYAFEGTRLTASARGSGGHDPLPQDVGPDWLSIGVTNLARSEAWYAQHLGAEPVERYPEKGWSLMRLPHEKQDENFFWLAQLPEGTTTGPMDAAARPYFMVPDREQYLRFYQTLVAGSVQVAPLVGAEGRWSAFHCYDPDGNRLNIWSYY